MVRSGWFAADGQRNVFFQQRKMRFRYLTPSALTGIYRASKPAAASTAAASNLSPSRSRPCIPSAPPPAPIPFPYIPEWEYVQDLDALEGEEAAYYSEALLPELPFEYHRPTDSATPSDFFPWEGLYRLPKIFYPDGYFDEEEGLEETKTTSTPSHSPTPFLVVNPDLRDVISIRHDCAEIRPSKSIWHRDAAGDDVEDDERLIQELPRGQGGLGDDSIESSGTATAAEPLPEVPSDSEPSES